MSVITTEIKSITPQLAMGWLEGNIHNRPIRQTDVQKYARSMTRGKWRLSHQGICFAEDGVLIDGQHRLWAIIESNHTIKMMVTRGMPMESQEVVDGHVVRSAEDVARLRDGAVLAKGAMGAARVLAIQAGFRSPSRDEQLECYDLHKNHINSAIGMFTNAAKGKGIKTVPVVVAITRALYSHKYEEIAPAIHVLCDGMKTDARSAVMILLRDALAFGKPTRDEVYGKAERALKAYLDNDPIKALTRPTGELFPLPNEQRARKKVQVVNPQDKKTRLRRIAASEQRVSA